MIRLYDKDANSLLGEISNDELQFLINHLEEEGATDEDYYIDRSTLDFLIEEGLPEHLKNLFQDAMGQRDAIEVRYKRED